MQEILLPLLILSLGAFFLVKLRGGPAAHPVSAAKIFWSGEREDRRLALRNLSLALAGTLGVGNITGVAVGMKIGGAGMLFWLAVSGVFTSVLKYAETLVTADRLEGRHGGMAACLKATFPRAGNILGAIYLALLLLLALTMGSGFQVAAAGDALSSALGIPLFPSAVVMTALLLLLTGGKSRRSASAAGAAVPAASAVYLTLCAVAILSKGGIGAVLSRIVREAFRPKSAVCGAGTFAFLSSVRCGFSSGLLSNEAGSGTSAMAHARSSASPVQKGILASTEVLFDTALCLLTGVVLCLGNPTFSGSGAEAVCLAFRNLLGGASLLPLAFSVAVFAVATVACWASYGEEAVSCLLENRKGAEAFRRLFAVLFFASCALGGFFDREKSVFLIDTLLALLCLLSAPALIKNADRSEDLSAEAGLMRPFI